MQDTIFEVNFPLSQVPGLFPIFQRIHHPNVEGCNTFNAPRTQHFGLVSKPPMVVGSFPLQDFFGTEDDLLSNSPIFFDSPKSENDFSESTSDSDLEKEFIFGGPASRELTPSPAPVFQELTSTGMTAPHAIPIISNKPKMEKFPQDKVTDFKHVIYNLLVDHYNNPEDTPFIEPVSLMLDGEVRTGFRFLDAYNPDKKLPELYAQHIRKARLDMENQDSVFIQDLYKFYLRACLELLSKYFEKADKYTFLDDELPLFVSGTSVKEAEARMKTMRTRARKRKSKEMKTGKRQNKRKCSWE